MDLAMLAGIDKNTIQKIETGKASPNVSTLLKIAEAFEMDFMSLTDVSKADL